MATNISGSVFRDIFVVSVYLPFLYLYFFFNSVGLPFGLQYTTILAPLFYFWLLKNHQRWVVSRFLVISLPFVAFHLLNGIVSLENYITSYALIMAVYLVVYAFYLAVTKCKDIDSLFKHIIVVNFLFTILAVFLRNSDYSYLLWWQAYSSGENIPRLMLLTYEASYYSTLLVPFFAFSYFKAIFHKEKYGYLLFFMTAIPLALSFSFGVISDLILTLAILHILFFKRLYHTNQFFFKVVMPVVLIVLLGLIVMTPFASRLTDVTTGQDMSGTGRVFWSSLISIEVASQKSLLWGVGFGQAKEYFDVMNAFMMEADNSEWMNGRLYNTMAEIFALTGAAGILLKLGLEYYFFVTTKPYTNYFRLSLFIFMFLYQFGGSYPTNVAEYAIWVFAFTKVFPEFDIYKSRTVHVVPSVNAGNKIRELTGQESS